MTQLHCCGCGRCQQEQSSPLTSGWRQRQIPETRAPAVLVDRVTLMTKMAVEDCDICFSAFSWPLLGLAQEVPLGGLSSLRPCDLLHTEECRSVKSGHFTVLSSPLRWSRPLCTVRLKNTRWTHMASVADMHGEGQRLHWERHWDLGVVSDYRNSWWKLINTADCFCILSVLLRIPYSFIPIAKQRGGESKLCISLASQLSNRKRTGSNHSSQLTNISQNKQRRAY